MTDSDRSVIETLQQEAEASINAQTAKIAWPELERYFARGVVVRVAKNLDLVKVAVAMKEDDKEQVEGWMKAGLIARATDKDAKRWGKEQPTLWAVVLAPWVVVQEAKEEA